ncbi:MAG: hypothetical protein J5715_03640 [Clostridiales bacterium]|nr:hypothetical protein [Clostridiales bacterium]
MIWFIAAMKCEAEPLSGLMGDNVTCILTGIGPDNAFYSVKKLIDSGKVSPFDKILNVGVCGAGDDIPKGSIHFINKITDMRSGKEYYPDLSLFPGDIDEGHIFTSDDIVTLTKPGELYDEEASAIFEAGQKFFSPDSMLFIKIVSDHGKDIPADEMMKGIISKHKDTIKSALERLSARSSEQEKLLSVPDLRDKLCLTEAMNNDMKNLLRYAKASGKLKAVEDYITELEEKGELPAKNKKEGAVYARRIKDMLTE